MIENSENVERFLRKLHIFPIIVEDEDKLTWKETKCSNSSVRSLYASLTRGGRERFLTSIVWSTWVPMKGGFFAWEVTLGRILMVGQLKRRGMDFTE